MAPFAVVVPQTVTVIEGGNITVICVNGGVPSPSILWTRIDHSKVVSHNALLPIVNISRPGTPDNMIQYQCTASNGVETPATATVNVTVHCKYWYIYFYLLNKNFRITCPAALFCIKLCAVVWFFQLPVQFSKLAWMGKISYR